MPHPANCQSSPVNPALTNAFGIYFHIPFCVHKCSYCDFYSFTNYEEGDFGKLGEHLQKELLDAKASIENRWGKLPGVRTIFFGGGTPSLVPAPLIGKLCGLVANEFELASDVEITLEANPETITPDVALAFRENTPVNRISLGAQSFDPAHLAKLERLGSPESIRQAVGCLSGVGYSNFSLDLIASIPGQTLESFVDDVKQAVQLAPKHLSFYTLTLKKDHPLAGNLPSEEEAADQYEAGIQCLADNGYRQYEISNFSRSGFECQHNLLYWTGGDFLGIGPSASSRFFREGKFFHRKQRSQFETYLGSEFEDVSFEPSTQKQTVLEAVFLELRANRGVQLEDFTRKYHYDLRQAKKFDHFVDEGFLKLDGNTLQLSHSGRMLADSVTAALVDL